jgi:ABC-type lipoprotein release transport system permease subunit
VSWSLALQVAGLGAAGLLLAVSVSALLFSVVESLRRAAVLPLAIRYATSRGINVVPPAGIAIGVAALIIVMSVMNGFISEHRTLIRGTLADLTIQPSAVYAGPGKRALPGKYADYKKILDTVPGVKASAPRYSWAAMVFPPDVLDIYQLSRHGEDFLVQVRGVDPEAERLVGDFERWIGPLHEDDAGLTDRERQVFQPPRDGRNPFPKFEPPGGRLEKDTGIVGVSIAVSLGLRRDGLVELVSFSPRSTRDKVEAANKNVYISGMFRSRDQNFDAHTVLMSIPAVQSLVGDDSADFTEIAVKVDDYSRVRQVRTEIGRRLEAAGLVRGGDGDRFGWNGDEYAREIVTWEEQRASFLAAVDNERGLLGFVVFMLVIVAAFIQFATLSMMVTEKTRDIGILTTLGASWGEIIAVFVDVGTAMTVIGEVAGLGLAFLVSSHLNEIDSFIWAVSGRRIFNPDIYYLKTIPSEIDPAQVAWILGLTLAAGVLASVVPALRAARLHPARALRYE